MRTEIPPAMFAPRIPAGNLATAPEPLELARSALLLPAGLDENRVANVLGDVMGHAVDYADIYFQLIREESWSLEDGIVKDGAHSIDGGVGVRALSGEKTGFAYSDTCRARYRAQRSDRFRADMALIGKAASLPAGGPAGDPGRSRQGGIAGEH